MNSSSPTPDSAAAGPATAGAVSGAPRRRGARRPAATVALLTATGMVAAGALSACGGGRDEPEKGTLRTAAETTAPSAPSSDPVPDTRPVDPGPCPYLSDVDASALDGEKILDVRTDHSLTPPACFFYTHEGRVALTTSVFDAGSEDTAHSLVDQSVPVDASERADLDGGWSGGKSTGAGGALLAVSRGSRVLVVNTTQKETVKVQRIAEKIAPELG